MANDGTLAESRLKEMKYFFSCTPHEGKEAVTILPTVRGMASP